MYIYVDILIITNIYANFFLLKTTAKLLHIPLQNGRCIFAAAAGSLVSLIILLPPLGTVTLLLIRIFSALFMIFLSFGGGKSLRELYRIWLVFFFVCFIFAGAEYGISVLAGGRNMLWRNSTLYVDISLLTLVVSTIVSYFAVSLFRHFLDGKNFSDTGYLVVITRNGRTAAVKAVGDTCNNLTDVFTGKPVIVCGRKSIAALLTETETEKLFSGREYVHINGFRLIPFSTIHSDGMLPVFKPSGVAVKDPESGRAKSADVYIGIADKDMEYAVFNPKILQ